MIFPDIGVVDLMIGFPDANARKKYESLRGLAKDAGSQAMDFPAEYMFKDVPNRLDEGEDPINITLEAMDQYGIAIGLVGLGNEATVTALERHQGATPAPPGALPADGPDNGPTASVPAPAEEGPRR